jgi:hypothetical protein
MELKCHVASNLEPPERSIYNTMFVTVYYFNAVLIFLLEQKGKRRDDLGHLLLLILSGKKGSTAPADIILNI